jgi:hypothetical protein
LARNFAEFASVRKGLQLYRQDHDQIEDLIRDKDDLLEVMLADPKLVPRLLPEEQNLVRFRLTSGSRHRRARGRSNRLAADRLSSPL